MDLYTYYYVMYELCILIDYWKVITYKKNVVNQKRKTLDVVASLAGYIQKKLIILLQLKLFAQILYFWRFFFFCFVLQAFLYKYVETLKKRVVAKTPNRNWLPWVEICTTTRCKLRWKLWASCTKRRLRNSTVIWIYYTYTI